MGGPAHFPTLPLVALTLVAAIAVILLLSSASGATPPGSPAPWDLPEGPVLPTASGDAD